MAVTKANSKAPKAANLKFAIDCNNVSKDGVFDVAAFESFLKDRFKVEGKAGNLGNSVSIKREGSKIVIASSISFKKCYLKYLTKKFLKKQQLRDWLHIKRADKETYELRYFNVANETAEADE